MKNAIENHIDKQQFVSWEQYEKLLSENEKLRSECEYLKQQLAELKRMIFGSKSERFIPTDDAQLSLFGDNALTPAVADTETQEITYIRERQTKEK